MLRIGALERRLLIVVLVALAPIVTLSCVNLVHSVRQQRAVGIPQEAIDGQVQRSYVTLGVGIALSLALGLAAAFIAARSVSRLMQAAEVSGVRDELLAAQERSESGARRLAAIVDSSDDAIVSKTLEGVITSWNRGAERMFGWAADEAVGRHIGLIIPEDRQAEEQDVLARIRRGESVDHYETVRVTKAGRPLNISLTVSPLRDSAGRVVGASKIARDVTERRRLEDERERLLLSEQQARADAEASNRAKDQLLATVSHELRTPLNAIIGWARLLQSGALDEAGRSHAVEVILRSGSTQAQLVEDLLDLSRFVIGRMRFTMQECEVTTVVQEALDAVRPAAAAKGIALVTALAPDVCPILCAPDRLRQVVWNLTMNAVKFTPAGGRIEVAVGRSNTHAEIAVVDNGTGISPDVLPQVFESFRQEDSSTTRAHGGLGIGLALVKEIVELHGGSVRAQSAGKGKGATFTVTIPLSSSSPGEADSQRRS
jgi:PAS domain S-box-containing protein